MARMILEVTRVMLLVASIGYPTGCRSDDEPPPSLAELAARQDKRFDAIGVADGIDAVEAEELANIYRGAYINGCGAALEPTRTGDVWTAGLLLGYAGTRSDRVIRVDARTGAVWSVGGPAFSDLAAFRRGVSKHFRELWR
jgi:hypothetical protein